MAAVLRVEVEELTGPEGGAGEEGQRVYEPAAETERAWSNGAIAVEHAIRGFYGVTLLLDDATRTGAILTDVLGFAEAGREGSIVRYRAPGAAAGAVVDLRAAKGRSRGRQGRGSVHHIAFRAADDAEQAAMAKKLVTQHGMHPTDQRDRNYFRSIPKDLHDAAQVDGCGEFRIYWNIYLPLAIPALATIAMMNFLSSWIALSRYRW